MFNKFARRSEHLIPRGYLWTLRKNTGDRAWPPAQTKKISPEIFNRQPVGLSTGGGFSPAPVAATEHACVADALRERLIVTWLG